jgi:hypothetical protein
MIRLVQILSVILIWFPLNVAVSGTTENYSRSSVLSSGRWFKIAVTEDGVYRIDFTKLKQLGLVNPSYPRIFGNNCGQLSYFNDGSAPDDLKEIAIFTNTGNDGVFNEGDYLLFYGKGPNRWLYDYSGRDFSFVRHNYSDTAYYFLTSGTSEGKRIIDGSSPAIASNFASSESDALYIYEKETENILHSGREWYQPVSYTKDTEINPAFRNIVTEEKIKYKVRVLARASVTTNFSLSENGTILTNLPIAGINLSSTTGTYAQPAETEWEALPSSQAPVYKVSFSNNSEISARGWIDYFIIHARKSDTFDGQPAQFTDYKTVGPGIVTEFTIKSSVDATVIWDVTDPAAVKIIPFERSVENITFKLATDTLKTVIAFLPANAKIPVVKSFQIPNQDLHASAPADMIVLTHPLFSRYAEQLAEFHKENSGLISLVVTPEQIYNEFSGGIPDIAAIRNFLRMKFINQKETDHPLKYLLLFGDGSFDNKRVLQGNTNFIPTYQTQNSNVIISSFTSDDFFGLLEDGEGEESGSEDLGIGRIPVSDTADARTVVTKIENYLSTSNQGDWKNVVTLIADDEDGNTHMSDAEGLADLIESNVPWVNVDKIYFDAYNQVTTATGQFYPDVTQAIDKRINDGTLIFNYIGHGNETSLGHERVVTPETIGKWKNITRLPLFITATCEFSRFDDITVNSVTGTITGKNSSGENILLDKKGGAIALMSTTRLVYSAPNYELNKNIIDVAFERDAFGNALRMGDIIRIAKNRSGSGTNKRNFLLLGDPAVRLSWPWHGNIITDSIYEVHAGEIEDTLKALNVISVTGHIEDITGNILSGFNGVVTPLVFAKQSEVQTLANDGGQKMIFKIRDKILFNGKTKALNGRFSYTFIVPRDIDYLFGKGKISYYASDQSNDMNGSFSDIIIGGFSNIINNDSEGPVIGLFLNDTLFRSGGLTDSNPRLLALIGDKEGINTSGTGIGHDLMCWLDNDHDNYIILNNNFENDFGSYTNGRIIYDFSGLSAGNHSLTLKAWDNYNNSSEKSIVFRVDDGDKFILKNLLNFPNPFYDATNISAEHNRPDELLDITVTIYNMNGETVRIIKSFIQTTGYQLTPVKWDGNLAGGGKAGRGVYPYRVTARGSNGETATISGRMIIY